MSNLTKMKDNKFLNMVRQSTNQQADQNQTEWNAQAMRENAEALMAGNDAISFEKNLTYLKELVEERMEGSNSYVQEMDIITNGLETPQQINKKKPGIKERKARKEEYRRIKVELVALEQRILGNASENHQYSLDTINQLRASELRLLRLEGYTEQSEVYISTIAKYDLFVNHYVDNKQEKDAASGRLEAYYSNVDLLKQVYTHSTPEEIMGDLEKLRAQFDKFSNKKLASHSELLGKSRNELLILWKHAQAIVKAGNREQREEKSKSAEDYRYEAAIKEEILNKSAEERKELTDEDEARISVSRTQAINRAFLADRKFGGDSAERKAIKDNLSKVELLLLKENFDASKDVEELLLAYQLTMSKCIHYTQTMKPDTDMGKERLEQVEQLSARLREDVAKIKLAERLLNEKKEENFTVVRGSDLLVLAEMSMRTDNKELEDDGAYDASEAFSLTLEDYMKVIGKDNRGQVEFRDGKLRVINNKKIHQTGLYEAYDILFGEDVKPTIANQQLRDHLYQIALDATGGNENIYEMRVIKALLGVGVGKAKALPIERRDLHRALARVAKVTLKTTSKNYPDVASATTDKEREKRLRYPSLAAAVRGNTYLTRDSELYEDIYHSTNHKYAAAVIKDVVKEGRKLGVKIDMPNSSQMGSLVHGGILIVQSAVFEATQKIMDYVYSMNPEVEVKIQMLVHKDPKQIGGRDAYQLSPDLQKLWALMLKKSMVHGELKEAEVEKEIEGFIRETAFKVIELSKMPDDYQLENAQNREGRQRVIAESKARYEKFERINVPKLAETDAESLESYITYTLASHKELEKDLDKIRQGASKLQTLAKNLKELTSLQNMAYKEGLNEEEAMKMTALATSIQSLLRGEDKAMIQFTVDKLKGSVYAQGFAEALKLEENNFLVQTVNEFVALTKDDKKVHEVKEDKKVVASTEERISRLSDDQAKIARVLLMENVFSGVISGIEKNEQGAYAQDIVKLCQILRQFPSRKVYSKETTVGGVKLNIIQTKENILRVKLGNETITLNREVGRIANALEDDIVLHGDIYGEDYAKNLIPHLKMSKENMGELSRSRSLCIKYLASKSGKPETSFTNVSSELLWKYVNRVAEGSLDAKSILRLVAIVDSSLQINGEETRELLSKYHQMSAYERKASVKLGSRKEAEKDGWTDDERSILNLFADIFYSEQTWTIDDNSNVIGNRMKASLSQNLGAISTLIDKPEILDELLEQIAFMDVEIEIEEKKEDGSIEIKKVIAKELIKDSVNEFLNEPEIQTLKKIPWVLRAGAVGVALNKKEVSKKIVELEIKIDTLLEKVGQKMQKEVSSAVDKMFSKAKKKDLAKIQELDAMCDEAINGDGGQGEFARNVFKRYFSKMPVIDQRSMIASAIRHAKPMTTLTIPEGAKEDEIKRIKEKEASINAANYLGGVLKGAGPLLQKMVQGLPIPADGSIPSEFVTAINDVKSKLSPIPERLVLARLQNIIDRSEGKITKLEVVKAMGAGSVGQAFLCNVEGPFLEAGKQVVVKILRPDVRNRMMREKDIMIESARITDKTLDENGKEFRDKDNKVIKKPKGGMQATYEAQLVRIEEELDLKIEAQYVQNATVYDQGFDTVHAMKMSDLVAPSTDTMVIEKAPGETIDGYLEALDEKQINIMKNFVEHEVNDKTGKINLKHDDKGYIMKKLDMENINQHYEAITEIKTMIETLRKRQKYVVDLANMWVTEAIFGGGFAMLDPHMGNIMVDDNGVTLIDYGNSAVLTERQQKYVNRMVIAAAIGDVDIFRHGFHRLLENTSEEVYKQKKPELNRILNQVFSLGDARAAGKRIVTVLAQAQALGLELPAALASFSQAQIRLQNTIESMNTKIAALEECEKALASVSSSDGFMTIDPLAEIINTSKEGQNNKVYKKLNTYAKFKTSVVASAGNITNDLQGSRDDIMADFDTMTQRDLDVKYLSKPVFVRLTAFKDFPQNYMVGLGKKVGPQKNSLYLLDYIKDSLLDCIDNEEAKIAAEAEVKKLIGLAEADEVKNSKDIIAGVAGLLKYSTVLSDAAKLGKYVEKRDEIKSGKLKDEALENAKVELDTLKQAAYEVVRNEYREKVVNLKIMNKVVQRLGNREGDDADMDKYINILCADQKLDEAHRNNLRKAYDEFKKVKTSNASDKEFRKSLADFLCDYRAISAERLLRYIKNSAGDTEDIAPDPDDFATVMSDIIQSNLKTSIKKLGRITAFFNRKKMNNDD